MRFMAISLAIAVAVVVSAWRAGILPQPKGPVVPEPVNLALSMHLSSAHIMVALDRGFFAQEGLRVNVTEYPSGVRALSEGLLTGKEDLCSAVELPVTVAIMEGQDIRLLAGVFNADNVNRVIARRSAGISRPEDLRGKRVATQRASAVQFFLDLFLTNHGISEADVQMNFLEAEELPEALLGNDEVVFAEPGFYPQTEWS